MNLRAFCTLKILTLFLTAALAVHMTATNPASARCKARCIELSKTDSAEQFKSTDPYIRGMGYFQQGEWPKAIEAFDLAIKSNPDDTRAYFRRGHALNQNRDYLLALANYDSLIKLNDSYDLAYYERGIIHFRLKQYDQAIKDFDSAIVKSGGLIKAIKGRGIAYYANGNLRAALTDFNEVLQYNSKDINIQKLRKQTLKKLKKANKS